MTLSLCVLGSGSAGNCTLVTLAGGRSVLIDAGLSPKRTVQRLAPLGVELQDITDVLLTHVDHDHLHRGWLELDVPFAWRAHRRHLRRTGPPRSGRWRAFDDTIDLGAGVRVEVTVLPHDRLGSCGFVIEDGGSRLGYATDLGRVTPSLLDRFTGLAAVALESNYDRELQVASNRPAVLKRRIMGGLGHLSNEQALEAALAVDRSGRLEHLALLHLSRQCNDPRLVKRLYARRAPHLLGRLTITSQHRATPRLCLGGDGSPRPVAGRQLDFLEQMANPAMETPM